MSFVLEIVRLFDVDLCDYNSWSKSLLTPRIIRILIHGIPSLVDSKREAILTLSPNLQFNEINKMIFIQPTVQMACTWTGMYRKTYGQFQTVHAVARHLQTDHPYSKWKASSLIFHLWHAWIRADAAVDRIVIGSRCITRLRAIGNSPAAHGPECIPIRKVNFSLGLWRILNALMAAMTWRDIRAISVAWRCSFLWKLNSSHFFIKGHVLMIWGCINSPAEVHWLRRMHLLSFLPRY